MKILYVTDLHGDKNKYGKSLDIAVEKNIGVIVNGGDMLPKLGERHLEQPLFINDFLRGYFSELAHTVAGRRAGRFAVPVQSRRGQTAHSGCFPMGKITSRNKFSRGAFVGENLSAM